MKALTPPIDFHELPDAMAFDECASDCPAEPGEWLSLHECSIGEESAPRINRITLSVKPGQLTLIIGPNEAGKSTLLQALAGDLAPDQGVAHLAGKPLTHWPAMDLARRRAVLPQHSTLQFDLMALDVVNMGRGPYNHCDPAEHFSAMRWALEGSGTSHLANRHYLSLSGGEQQRVQLARVLAQLERSTTHPRYLLLDEPTSALDLSHQHSVLALTRRLAQNEGFGVLAVLHDLNLAAQYADRALVMHRAGIVADGPPGEVMTEDLLESVYGLPVMVLSHPWQNNRPLILPCPPLPELRTRPNDSRTRQASHSRARKGPPPQNTSKQAVRDSTDT